MHIYLERYDKYLNMDWNKMNIFYILFIKSLFTEKAYFFIQHTHIHTCKHMHAHTYTHQHTHGHTCMSMHMHAHMHTYTSMDTHTHAHTYAHACAPMPTHTPTCKQTAPSSVSGEEHCTIYWIIFLKSVIIYSVTKQLLYSVLFGIVKLTVFQRGHKPDTSKEIWSSVMFFFLIHLELVSRYCKKYLWEFLTHVDCLILTNNKSLGYGSTQACIPAHCEAKAESWRIQDQLGQYIDLGRPCF